MDGHELTIELLRHDNQRVRILDHCVCQSADLQEGIEKAIAFAHWAAMEIYVQVDDEPFIHYANLEWDTFISELLKRLK